MKIQPLIIFIAMIAIFMACGDGAPGEEEISTEFVKNPLTASGKGHNDQKAVMAFEKNKYDFGKIIQGEKISHSFSFINEGNAPLIIASVSASCGCTVPSWSKNPIAAGEGGKIDIVFDSDGKQGIQTKDITVVSNAVPNTSVLRISGEVVVP